MYVDWKKKKTGMNLVLDMLMSECGGIYTHADVCYVQSKVISEIRGENRSVENQCP